MSVGAIQCPQCGGPLPRGGPTKSAVCEHCGSRLHIAQSPSGNALATVAEMQANTEIVAKQTAINYLQQQLEQRARARQAIELGIDAELERAVANIPLHRPTPVGAMVGCSLAGMGVLAGCALIMSSGRGLLPGFVLLASLLCGVIGIRLFRQSERRQREAVVLQFNSIEAQLRAAHEDELGRLGADIETLQQRLAELHSDMSALAGVQ